jgi:hypothetical protein
MNSFKSKLILFQFKKPENKTDHSKESLSNAYRKTDEFFAIINQLERACCYSPKKIKQIYRSCGSIKTNQSLMEDLEDSLNNLPNMENIDQLCGFVKEYLKMYCFIS